MFTRIVKEERVERAPSIEVHQAPAEAGHPGRIRPDGRASARLHLHRIHLHLWHGGAGSLARFPADRRADHGNPGIRSGSRSPGICPIASAANACTSSPPPSAGCSASSISRCSTRESPVLDVHRHRVVVSADHESVWSAGGADRGVFRAAPALQRCRASAISWPRLSPAGRLRLLPRHCSPPSIRATRLLSTSSAALSSALSPRRCSRITRTRTSRKPQRRGALGIAAGIAPAGARMR